MECGLNTGCVKIFIDSEEMLMRKQREYGFEFSGQGRYSINRLFGQLPIIIFVLLAAGPFFEPT